MNMQDLINAGCTPTTPVSEALNRVAKRYGHSSQQFQSFLAFVRTNSPESVPAKYRINGHVKQAVPVKKATISGSVSPTNRLIKFLETSIEWSRVIPDHFVSLSSLRG